MRSRLISHMLTFFCYFFSHFSLSGILCRGPTVWIYISMGLGLLLHRGVFAPTPSKCDLLSSLQRRTFAREIISAAPVVTKHFFDLLPLSECCLESYLRMKVSSNIYRHVEFYLVSFEHIPTLEYSASQKSLSLYFFQLFHIRYQDGSAS